MFNIFNWFKKSKPMEEPRPIQNPTVTEDSIPAKNIRAAEARRHSVEPRKSHPDTTRRSDTSTDYAAYSASYDSGSYCSSSYDSGSSCSSSCDSGGSSC